MSRKLISFISFIQEFTNEHLDSVLQNISMENKQCVIMGDFNINLLKIDTSSYSNLFYNTMSSHFFRLTSYNQLDFNLKP